MSSATATPPALVNANFIVLSAVTIVWQIDSERPPTTVPERLPTTTESAFTSVLVTVNRPEVSSSAIAADAVENVSYPVDMVPPSALFVQLSIKSSKFACVG